MMKKQRKTFQSVDIPHDILLQVLAWLPAKSLLRFKCVCKLWYSIVTDPQFVELHRKCSQTRLGGNYLVTFWHYRDAIMISFMNHDGRRRVPPPMQLKLKPQRQRGRIRICPPLNGLVCMYWLNHHHRRGHALVLNISTRQIVHLPHIRFGGYLQLGFDQVRKTYKVLNWYFDHDRQQRCAIYSLGTDTSWREVMNPPESIWSAIQTCVVSGSIYWLVVDADNTFLIAFEVGKEVFRTLRFAEHVHNGSEMLYAVGGWLAWIPRADEVKHPTEIWLLEECQDDNQVLVKEKISIPQNLVRGGNAVSILLPFVVNHKWYPIPKGISPKEEMVFLDPTISRKVYLDLKEKTFKVKRFKWPHPRRGEEDKRLTFLRYKVRYNHVENMYRFKVQDDVGDRHGSFLLEDS